MKQLQLMSNEMFKKMLLHIRIAGFSLIELLIVISLIMIIGGGVIANYDKFNRQQIVKQTAQTFKNDLRLAQGNAISSLKPAGCTELVGYQVSFTPNSYTTQAKCTNGLIGPLTTVNLPSGVALITVPSGVPILFGVLTRGLENDVAITFTGSGYYYEISVSRSGDINDIGTPAAAPPPPPSI